jgi:DNA polymerase type B, organellar and viral
LNELKLNKRVVFSHNLGSFDGYFIFKGLLELPDIDVSKVNFIIDDLHRFISIDILWKNTKLIFKDSLRIFPVSLQELCSLFGVEGKLYPYNPEFNKITLFENEILLNQFIEYSKQDSISLLKALMKAQKIYIDEHEVDIASIWSTSTLSFKIFRPEFFKISIKTLTNKLDKIIRLAYIGGSTDYYLKYGENLKHYDVNSLYPSQMQSQLMPVGVPTYFEGDIIRMNKDAFGFFYCKITAPDNIKHPILQTHVKTNNGIRTISPVGTWEDMIFSEEMNNAMKYGYTFEILWGYTFDSANIFKEYVDFLYKLRSEYPKSHPLNYIAKILLNSLYGRLGMDDNFPEIKIIHKDYYADFENKFLDDIIDKVELDESWLVFYKSTNLDDISSHNVSIGIAAAITAYSRIHMSQFKNNPNINLYYSDTDSIYTDSELDETLINNKVLGKLKLEHVANRAIFLTPKVYCLELENGETLYKAKGLKHEIELTFDDFKKLLFKDVFIEKTQTKWFRKLSDAKINLLEELYTLKLNENKRAVVFDKNNKFVSTKAYKISEDKTIKLPPQIIEF